jgi:hypothetical protein
MTKLSDTPTNISRFLRLHTFEIIIFIVLGLLMALCLTVAPLISNDVRSVSPDDVDSLIL